MKFACPCCGRLTLDEQPPGTYEICSTCNWEDDPVQFEDPYYAGGANRESLVEARDAFSRKATWCCMGMQNHFLDHDKRGVQVIAGHDDSRLRFRLLFRSVALEDRAAFPKLNVPITFDQWMMISHCPWCGVDLERRYANEPIAYAPHKLVG